MSTAQSIVTRAYRALSVLDLNAAAPSPLEMSVGLEALNSMVDSWATQGLATAQQNVTGTLISGSAVVTSIDTSNLAPGLNITGTGIPSETRIKSVDSRSQVTLTQSATADGTAVAIAVTPLPFEAKYERGIVALLALELAPLASVDDVPAAVVRQADEGWKVLQAGFIVVPTAQFDAALTSTISQQRTSVIIDD